PAVSGTFARSLFFFSSRRRHTRWPRDWSSDVCSSDLPKLGEDELGRLTDAFNQMLVRIEDQDRELRRYATELEQRVAERTHELRSEERRVGKEWRTRWWPCS